MQPGFWGRAKPPSGTPLEQGNPLAPDGACWVFNEGAGSFVRDYAGRNDLTLSGTFSWQASAAQTVGPAPMLGGPAVRLTSSGSGAAQCTAPETIQGQYTIVIAFVPIENNNGQPLFYARGSGFDTLDIQYDAQSGNNSFSSINIGTGGGFLVTGAASTANASILNQFGTVALVVMDEGYVLYVNGVRNAGGTYASPGIPLLCGASNPLRFGADGTGFFDMTLLYAYVFRRALTAQEVQQLYATPYGGFAAPAFRRWFVPAAAGGFTAEIDSIVKKVTASLNAEQRYLVEADPVLARVTAAVNAYLRPEAEIDAIIAKTIANLAVQHEQHTTITTTLAKVTASISLQQEQRATVASEMAPVTAFLNAYLRPEAALTSTVKKVAASLAAAQEARLSMVSSLAKATAAIAAYLRPETTLTSIVAKTTASLGATTTEGFTIRITGALAKAAASLSAYQRPEIAVNSILGKTSAAIYINLVTLVVTALRFIGLDQAVLRMSAQDDLLRGQFSSAFSVDFAELRSVKPVKGLDEETLHGEAVGDG